MKICFKVVKFQIFKLNKKMAKIQITQIKSGIDRPERQKKTLKALGFSKMHQVIEVEGTPQILGMVNKVSHLVSMKQV